MERNKYGLPNATQTVISRPKRSCLSLGRWELLLTPISTPIAVMVKPASVNHNRRRKVSKVYTLGKMDLWNPAHPLKAFSPHLESMDLEIMESDKVIHLQTNLTNIGNKQNRSMAIQISLTLDPAGKGAASSK